MPFLFRRTNGPQFGADLCIDLCEHPAPTILGGGIAGGGISQYYLEQIGMNNEPPHIPGKPPYRVPTVEEINRIPWNGHTVASTFSGGGGSCLGYRMAGFRVVWANEFIPHARETYKANADPACILDGRDIRQVKPEEIMAATGLKVGELDVLDGSPPCDSFSTAGSQEKLWGVVKDYSGKRQRTDDLTQEYIRLLRGLKPRTFIMENVAGLVRGVCKGYFLEMLADLKASGYRVECRVLDAQWLGVPQSRRRTIFVGVREDLGLDPVHPKPLPYVYTVRDACPWIVRHGIDSSGIHAHQTRTSNEPSVAVTTMHQHYWVEGGGPEDISRFAIGEEWAKLTTGRVSRKYLNLKKADPAKPCPTITGAGGQGSTAGVVHPYERRKFSIAEIKRLSSFPDDFKVAGSYAKQWQRFGQSVPPVMMFHVARVVADLLSLAKAPGRKGGALTPSDQSKSASEAPGLGAPASRAVAGEQAGGDMGHTAFRGSFPAPPASGDAQTAPHS